MTQPTGPPRAQLLRIARQLEKSGKRLEARALRAVIAAYAEISLTDLVALLQGASQPLYAAGRVANLDMLMRTFRQATASLARPPSQVASLLTNAVNLGSVTGAEMIAAAARNPEIIEAFRLRPDREIDLAQHASKRLLTYWGTEQARLADQVQSALLEGLERGQGPREMAARLRERVSVSKSRALLIARTETARAMSAGSEVTQREAGVTEYEWLATNDSRTRPEHRARDGKIFRWDDPPSGGHVGTEPNCRCVALAVIPEGFL